MTLFSYIILYIVCGLIIGTYTFNKIANIDGMFTEDGDIAIRMFGGFIYIVMVLFFPLPLLFLTAMWFVKNVNKKYKQLFQK